MSSNVSGSDGSPAAGSLLDPGCLCERLASDGLDFTGAPLSVEETLLEVAVAGPGPEAIGLLESLTGRSTTSGERLQIAGAWERQSRWLSARQQAANVAFVGVRAAQGRDGERAETSARFELALETDCGDLFLKYKIGVARLLATTLTATAAQLESGQLSDYRARIICDKLTGLDPDVARRIEARVLPTAAQVKVATLTDKLRRARLAAQGPEAAQEHAQGLVNRRVVTDREPSEPGLLGLHAYLPAETTLAVREVLESKAAEFARADKARHKVDGSPKRTKDQRIADALAWHVLGPADDDPSTPARPRVVVQLTMSLPTLLALRDNPADLPGYGPIPAQVARHLAHDADWHRFVHDPVTGYLLDCGNDHYRPTDELRQFLINRDVTDRFPGSHRKAHHGDNDHTEPYQQGTGGHTSATGMSMLARIGHIAKTHNNWTCTGDANGILTWTSPHGRHYQVPPHDYRDDEPNPPPNDPPPF